MRSKTSKIPKIRPSQWKAARAYSEAALQELAKELAKDLQPGDRVQLEGPLGAGKTTFARALLLGLGVRQPPEGSPSFAIAHEYQSVLGEVVHIDFYRIRDESEIDDAGIPSYFWERRMIVIAEWLSSWPDFEKKVWAAGRNWKVSLAFNADDPQRRDVVIEKFG